MPPADDHSAGLLAGATAGLGTTGAGGAGAATVGIGPFGLEKKGPVLKPYMWYMSSSCWPVPSLLGAGAGLLTGATAGVGTAGAKVEGALAAATAGLQLPTAEAEVHAAPATAVAAAGAGYAGCAGCAGCGMNVMRERALVLPLQSAAQSVSV